MQLQTPPQERRSQRPVSRGTKVLLAVFLTCILLPLQPEVASIRLEPFRIFLLLALFPGLMVLTTRTRGGVNIIDVMVLLLVGWMLVTFIYHHGMDHFPLAVMTAIEVFGAYMIGRVLVTSFEAWRVFLLYYLIAMAILLPLAWIESSTGSNYLLDFFSKFLPTNPSAYQVRNAMVRAQSVFAHPIHFGIFGSLLVAALFYGFRSWAMRLTAVAVAYGISYYSQSSAPLMAVGLQIGVIVWGVVTRRSWWVLFWLVSAVFVFLELASNRGPFIIAIETLTLNPSTAWWRVHIFNYGMENVWDNPIMGLGLNDWQRPSWLAPTIDNFWLVITLRHGIPAFIFMFIAFLIHGIRILARRGLDRGQAALRLGYMISLLGLVFSFTTVHAWGQVLILVMFFIGAGAFFYTGEIEEPSAGPGKKASENNSTKAGFASDHRREPKAPGKLRYTRFSPNDTSPQNHDRRTASVMVRENEQTDSTLD